MTAKRVVNRERDAKKKAAKKVVKKKSAGGRKKRRIHHRNVTLSKQAFIGMITNSIEVYKKETFGFVLGRKHRNHYFAADTATFQSADRDYEYVNIKANKINRMNYALRHLTNYELIGDYHSHPGGPDRLSNVDVEDLLRKITRLTFLISIYKTNRCVAWEYSDDGGVVGTIGSRYLVKIKAYEIDHKERIVHEIKIVCPYIRKINKYSLYKDRFC